MLADTGRQMQTSSNYIKLEPAVDGAPSQIPMLKFLPPPPAPQVPPLDHDPGNRMKILFNMFSIFYLWEHTQSLV